MARGYDFTPQGMAQRYRATRRRRIKQERARQRAELREKRLAALEEAVTRHEGLLFPEPHEDTGWEELAAGGRIEWSPDNPRKPLARIDLFRRTGADEFAPIADNREEGGGVWFRSHEVDGLPLYVLYNMTNNAVEVRVQCWYSSPSEAGIKAS